MINKKVWGCTLALSALLVGCAQADTPAKEEEAPQHEHTHEHEHKHEHTHEHAERNDIAAGYFKDDQVKDRALTDWQGDWQSIYPLLQDGTLDAVFEHKAEHDPSKTPEAYKAYYEEGYKTTTERIVIDGDQVTFYENNQPHTGTFAYDGYEILTYEKGNRGVRYIFKQTSNVEGVPAFIQFSDHIIAPQKSGHFHLYWGDDRAKLLEEVTHWPTYFPATMTKDDILHDMLAH